MPVETQSGTLYAERQTLSLKPHGEHVLVIQLNRPAASNAINTRMATDLMELFEGISLDSAGLRCLVLTGAGESSFCAGADLKERRGLANDVWEKQHLILERMIRALLGCPVPVIAAVNGAAYGGGCEIAAACDFIYASATARFALPEVALGIMPGAGGTQSLARAMGERRAKEIILAGLPFSAEDAAMWGLVNRVCSPGELMQAALQTAERIASNAPLSVRQAKLSVHQGLQLSLLDGLAFEIEAYRRLVPTEDRREGNLAFNERRQPVFQGR